MEEENALRANIKRKGENSYYYAHQPRAREAFGTAQVLEGEGIITGRDPQIAYIPARIIPTATVIPIRNYSWADEAENSP